jgi:hypothetical protein
LLQLKDRQAGEASLAMAYAAQGKRAEAEGLLTRLQKTASTGVVSPTLFAMTYHALGDTDRALTWLEKAYVERKVDLIALRAPYWDGLRAEPRFQSLWQRMHFPE